MSEYGPQNITVQDIKQPEYQPWSLDDSLQLTGFIGGWGALAGFALLPASLVYGLITNDNHGWLSSSKLAAEMILAGGTLAAVGLGLGTPD